VFGAVSKCAAENAYYDLLPVSNRKNDDLHSTLKNQSQLNFIEVLRRTEV